MKFYVCKVRGMQGAKGGWSFRYDEDGYVIELYRGSWLGAHWQWVMKKLGDIL